MARLFVGVGSALAAGFDPTAAIGATAVVTTPKAPPEVTAKAEEK